MPSSTWLSCVDIVPSSTSGQSARELSHQCENTSPVIQGQILLMLESLWGRLRTSPGASWEAANLWARVSVACGAPCGYTACTGVPQYLCHKSMALVTIASVFSCGIWKKEQAELWAFFPWPPGMRAGIVYVITARATHIAQKLHHAIWPGDAHQHDLVAEQNLQGHKHQDLTGSTDHLVPHPKKRLISHLSKESPFMTSIHSKYIKTKKRTNDILAWSCLQGHKLPGTSGPMEQNKPCVDFSQI